MYYKARISKRRHIQPASFLSLTVRLLVAGTGTGTTKLLGLAATRVGNEEGAVVLDEDLADLLLARLIDD